MKLLIADRPSINVISGVNEGIPITRAYPLFIVEPESNDDVTEAVRLFAELFETYSKEE
jgi:hypothetical protein